MYFSKFSVPRACLGIFLPYRSIVTSPRYCCRRSLSLIFSISYPTVNTSCFVIRRFATKSNASWSAISPNYQTGVFIIIRLFQYLPASNTVRAWSVRLDICYRTRFPTPSVTIQQFGIDAKKVVKQLLIMNASIGLPTEHLATSPMVNIPCCSSFLAYPLPTRQKSVIGRCDQSNRR